MPVSVIIIHMSGLFTSGRCKIYTTKSKIMNIKTLIANRSKVTQLVVDVVFLNKE